MKWKAKPIPKAGDERWTKIFALIPTRCEDGYVRWLCPLYRRQRYAIYGELAGTSWVSIEYYAPNPALNDFVTHFARSR